MIKDIIESFKQIFNGYGLQLKENYDVEQVVDGDGVIVISVTNIQRLQPQLNDYKITLNISGQTYIDNDLDQTKIQAMFKHCSLALSMINVQIINVVGVVGYIYKESSIIDSEATHGFTAQIDLFATQFQL